MNKLRIILLLFFSVSLLIAGGSTAHSRFGKHFFAGKIQKVHGKVWLKSKHRPPHLVKKGDKIRPGNKIFTGSNSAVTIKFRDKSTFTLGPKTILGVKKFYMRHKAIQGVFVANIPKGVFNFTAGKIAESNSNGMKVALGSLGVVNVHGTPSVIGEISVDQTNQPPSRSAIVALVEPENNNGGSVIVSNDYGSVEVNNPGNGTEITDNQSSPTPATEIQIEIIDGILRALRSFAILQPRSFPFALQADSGEADATFKVHIAKKTDIDLGNIFLRTRRDNQNVTQLNDAGKDGDIIAGDGIYGGMVSINTNQYNPQDCLLFEAYSIIEGNEVTSPLYPLCFTSYSATMDRSNEEPDNQVKLPGNIQAIADEILVRFREGTDERRIEFIARFIDAEVVGSILPRNLYQFRFRSALSADELLEVIERLNNFRRIESAYPNALGSFSAVPNDTLFTDQHGLQHINADDAWDLGATGSGVTITILDSGINAHADLSISDGVDAINHGTAVAGVAAATTDNATGIAGIARDSSLQHFTVSADASVSIAEMVTGFQTVASSGVGAIVNASFSISSAPPASDFPVLDQWDLCAAIDDVVLNTSTPVAVVVTAAGNNGTDGWHYPSKCNDNSAPANANLTRKDLIIPVLNSWSCSTGCTPDTIEGTSNYGTWVDVAAPGTDVRSTDNAASYDFFTGTSFSAPMVSGAAAQLLSCGVALDQIEPILISTAPTNVVHPSGSTPRIDVLSAVNASTASVPTDITFAGTTSINENTDTTGGLNLGTLSTVDPDGCDQHSYSIQPGADGAFFTLGGVNSDELILDDGILDFETQANYWVIMRTTDASSNVYDEWLQFTVNDLNDPPSVSNQAFAIDENEPNGTSVGTVSASDQDGGEILSYAIIAGNTGTAFAINSSSGEITVNNSTALNFEATPSFGLTVQVTDSGLLSDSATVTIDINDINEAPSISNQSFNLNENSPNGTSVGVVPASDPDAGDILSFSITGGNTGTAFAINSSSGEITVNNSAAVDFETTPSFALTVQVTDSGLLNDSATITINLNNVFEPGDIIPNPIIDWVLPVPFETYNDAFGDPYVRYRFEVTNRNLYPIDMFDPAPLLPPCGLNTSASRTWVNIYNGVTDAYIYGFCALGTPDNLGSIWFAVPLGDAPPPSIYITLVDRQTSITYTSNILAVP